MDGLRASIARPEPVGEKTERILVTCGGVVDPHAILLRGQLDQLRAAVTGPRRW